MLPVYWGGGGMNGHTSTKMISAAAMMMPIERAHSFEYRQASRQLPNVSKPLTGTMASKIAI
jgi:hypothetical protein